MDADKRKNIIVGVLSLMSLPVGIWLIYQYLYAPPNQIDSFDLGSPQPTCYTSPVGDVILQVPITRDDEWDEISRITLVEPNNMTIAKAGLLAVGRAPEEQLGYADIAALTVDVEGWFELGKVARDGQTLVLVLDRPKSGAASAEAIRIGVYLGETRWRDDLPVRVEVAGGKCTVTVGSEPSYGPGR
jgi:hypothetical protein